MTTIIQKLTAEQERELEEVREMFNEGWWRTQSCSFERFWIDYGYSLEGWNSYFGGVKMRLVTDLSEQDLKNRNLVKLPCQFAEFSNN